jgi:hypothetical protein
MLQRWTAPALFLSLAVSVGCRLDGHGVSVSPGEPGSDAGAPDDGQAVPGEPVDAAGPDRDQSDVPSFDSPVDVAASADAARDQAADLRADVPADAPVDTAADLAPDGPMDLPADPAVDVPADAPTDLPFAEVSVDGAGNGQACDADGGGGSCASGVCEAGICCDVPCAGPCRACTADRTGQPDGICAPVLAGRSDPGCPPEAASTCGRDGTCDGSGACRRHPDGTVCGGVCCSGGPGGVKPCTFVCRGGSCDTATPIPGPSCNPGCCCATGGAGGGPSCVLPGAACAGPCL